MGLSDDSSYSNTGYDGKRKSPPHPAFSHLGGPYGESVEVKFSLEGVYECPDPGCSATFTSLKALISHRKTIHSGAGT